ncbi:hypothetical protein [Occallatibacter savannae]|uniref:hypothetical protein n=1 Tax=Occallatibacter savannae TaxID=1002691 RepID=UPI0013A54B39|nr:hypothetical protein [Occallatibacter savannae]
MHTSSHRSTTRAGSVGKRDLGELIASLALQRFEWAAYRLSLQPERVVLEPLLKHGFLHGTVSSASRDEQSIVLAFCFENGRKREEFLFAVSVAGVQLDHFVPSAEEIKGLAPVGRVIDMDPEMMVAIGRDRAVQRLAAKKMQEKMRARAGMQEASRAGANPL